MRLFTSVLLATTLTIAATGPKFERRTLAALIVASIAVHLLAKRTNSVSIPWQVWLLTIFPVASIVWSDDRSASIGAVLLLVSIIAGTVILLSTSSSAEEFHSGLYIAALLSVTASVLFIQIFPEASYVTETHETGALKSFYSHRNNFSAALIMALGLGFLARTVVSSKWIRHTFPLFLITTMAVLFKTSSVTALLTIGASVTILLALLLFKRLGRLMAAFFMLLISVTGLVIYGAIRASPIILAHFNRDTTFTGRTTIWEVSLAAIKDSPFLGYGWGAVWSQGSSIGEHLRNEIGFAASHAHNGFLDLALLLGVPFTLVVTLTLLALAARAVRRYLQSSDSVALSVFAVIISLIVSSLTENTIATNAGLFSLVICLLTQRHLESTGKKVDASRHSVHTAEPKPDTRPTFT